MNILYPSLMCVGLARIDLFFPSCDSEFMQEELLEGLRSHIKKKADFSLCFYPHKKWDRVSLGLSLVGEDSQKITDQIEDVSSCIQEQFDCDVVDCSTEILTFP